MAIALTTPNTLFGALQPRAGLARLVAVPLAIVLGTLLITLAAKISVPVWPVPVTLQSMAVAGLAAAFGWRIGVATVALYLIEGMAGLPVFASGGGAAYLMGPTGGFLLGYLPMAYLIGRASDAGASRNALRLGLAMLAGEAVLLACGYAWLVALSGGAGWIDQSNVLLSAFEKAVAPFIVWDLLKLAFAGLTVSGLWTLLSPRR